MALINHTEMLFLIFMLYMFLHYPSRTNAYDVAPGPPNGSSIHFEDKKYFVHPEHPMQDSVHTLCDEIQDPEAYCSAYFEDNLNASGLAHLTLDLGQKQLLDIINQLYIYHVGDVDPATRKELFPQLLTANFTFTEARMVVNHPKTAVNPKRMDAIGNFPRLAELLRRKSATFRDQTTKRMIDFLESVLYIAYELTVEVVWTTK